MERFFWSYLCALTTLLVFPVALVLEVRDRG